MEWSHNGNGISYTFLFTGCQYSLRSILGYDSRYFNVYGPCLRRAEQGWTSVSFGACNISVSPCLYGSQVYPFLRSAFVPKLFEIESFLNTVGMEKKVWLKLQYLVVRCFRFSQIALPNLFVYLFNTSIPAKWTFWWRFSYFLKLLKRICIWWSFRDQVLYQDFIHLHLRTTLLSLIQQERRGTVVNWYVGFNSFTWNHPLYQFRNMS